MSQKHQLHQRSKSLREAADSQSPTVSSLVSKFPSCLLFSNTYCKSTAVCFSKEVKSLELGINTFFKRNLLKVKLLSFCCWMKGHSCWNFCFCFLGSQQVTRARKGIFLTFLCSLTTLVMLHMSAPCERWLIRINPHGVSSKEAEMKAMSQCNNLPNYSIQRMYNTWSIDRGSCTSLCQ